MFQTSAKKKKAMKAGNMRNLAEMRKAGFHDKEQR